MQDVVFRLSADAKAQLMKLKVGWQVLYYLAQLAEGAESFRTRCQDIAKECRLSANTAQKTIRALERMGLLQVLAVEPCLTLKLTESVFIAKNAMIANFATLTSTSSFYEGMEVLLGYWNHWAAPNLRGIEILDLGERERKHLALLAETYGLDPVFWQTVIGEWNRSSWLCGISPGKRGTHLHRPFNFFLQPGTIAKVLDGKYRDRKPRPAPTELCGSETTMEGFTADPNQLELDLSQPLPAFAYDTELHNISSPPHRGIADPTDIDDTRQNTENQESRFGASNPDSPGVPAGGGDGPIPLAPDEPKGKSGRLGALDEALSRARQEADRRQAELRELAKRGVVVNWDLWQRRGNGESTSDGQISGDGGAGGGWRRGGLQQSAGSLHVVHRAQSHSGASPEEGIDPGAFKTIST